MKSGGFRGFVVGSNSTIYHISKTKLKILPLPTLRNKNAPISIRGRIDIEAEANLAINVTFPDSPLRIATRLYILAEQFWLFPVNNLTVCATASEAAGLLHFSEKQQYRQGIGQSQQLLGMITLATLLEQRLTDVHWTDHRLPFG